MNQISSALGTDQGKRRPHNEDYIAFFEPNDLHELQASGNIYIVADGVGGAEKGERASRFAVQKVLYEYYQHPGTNPGDRLRSAMRQAGNEIYKYATESVGLTRMATTMVAAVIRDQALTVANVGDSRAYLIRNGRIEQITQDHSIVGEMVRNGLMTEEEASRSKVKNKITRSLGGEVDVRVDVFKTIPLQQGDLVLLCSDGLTRYATSKDLIQIASQYSLEEAVKQMVDFANTAGGMDNISAILIKVGQPLGAEDPTLPLPRGHMPEPVDWDTMQTQPSLKTGKKKSISQEHLLIAAGVLLLIIMFGMVIITYRLLISQPSPNPTEIPDSAQAISAETMSITQELLKNETPAAEVSLPPISVAPTPTNALTDSFAISQTQTISETSMYTENISLTAGFCVYEVKADDYSGLSVVLSEFDLPYASSSLYYFYKNCELDPPFCSDKTELPAPHNIDIGYWLLIEGVDQQSCEEISDAHWITHTE